MAREIPGVPASEAATTRLDVRALCSAQAGPFDLQVDGGECVMLMGASGSGKTVLLRLIADLDPGSGSVSLNGQAREAMPAHGWRRQVIYQAAEPAWWAPTVRAHLAPQTLPRVEALIPRLGLAPAMLDADLTRLSTGERQRFALLRSLSCQPAVLLLDEPTAALDVDSTLAYEQVLQGELARGLGVLWVTHSPEQARRMGHRCIVLDAPRREHA
jgi:ABC-type iron transport system FetAB ATPase subunit